MGANFGFRVTAEERKLITAVAKRLNRGESDMVRLLIREVARELGVTPQAPGATQAGQKAEKGGKRAAA